MRKNRTYLSILGAAIKKERIRKAPRLSRFVTAFSLVVASGMALVFAAPSVGAAACPVPTTDYGSVTLSVNVPATATYVIWTRMKAPSATQNTVNLQVDTSACYSVGGGSLVAGSWATNSSNWINYQNGAPSNVVTLSLPAGAHTLKYIGAQAGVEIDRVIMTSDSSCTPSGVGTNCESGDSTAPTISLQVLSAGQPVTAGQTVNGSLTMNATAADASGIANVQFLVDGNAVSTDTSSPYSFSWNSATTSNGSHTLSARATDTKNNAATSTNLAVNVSNTVSCTGTPSVPGNLHVTSTSANAVGLAWNASTPAAGCNLQGYKVFRNGTQVAAPTGTTYTDSGLTPGTTYNYTVAAIDTGNHVSGQSTAASGVTAADTTAPSVPANLRSTLKTASSVALAWDASTDNTGVKDYVIYRNGTQVGTSTTASFTDSALVPNTAYSFTVKARDLANNLSAASSALSVTTLSGTNANKGDLNTDNKVNLTDLAILLAHWQQAGVPITQGDVNSSGKVDLVDLAMLLSNWNKTL